MPGRQVLRALPLRARTLPRVEYAKDLQSITPHSIRDQIGLVGNCPFAGMFHPTFASHGRKLSQPVDTGENGIREVVGGFWIFESDIVRFVSRFLSAFSSHSTRIPAPAPSAHGRHLVISGEFAFVGVFYRQINLSG